MQLDTETAYWLLSTMAQCLAALMAFIAIGYFFILRNLETDDETLLDIYESLKTYYYKIVVVLLSLFTISLIGNLVSLSLIKSSNQILSGSILLMILIFMVLGALSFILTFWFICVVANPKRVEKDAKKSMKKVPIKEKEKIDASKLIANVVEIEKLIRNILCKRKLVTPDMEQKMTLVEMIDFLKGNELIEEGLHHQLQELRYYRNLAVHGRIEEVDKGMFEISQYILKKLKELDKE
jgi:hypothetical protein